jgi:hypothetical protein
MRYDFMHKDIKVANLILGEDDGAIYKVENVRNLEHMPIGTVRKGFLDGRAFKGWWNSRSIPASRSGIKDVLYELDYPSTILLIEKCMGLSLSDQYWIRKEGTDIGWEDVNFFDNEFSEDMGDLLFGRTPGGDELSLSSPDNTSDGVLKKRWKIIDGERCLIKGGSGQNMQEPFNEVIASLLMSSQSIDYVDYRMLWMKDYPYSVCKDFIDGGTELVTAYYLVKSIPQKQSDNLFMHYVRVCEDMGVDIIPFLDRILVIDYIMMNSDRHMGNFGLVRDAETLEFLGPAPIYDTGTSLGCNIRTDRFATDLEHKAKPFKGTFHEQLGLVSSFDWFDAQAMLSVLPNVDSILDERGFIGVERKQLIMELLE